ncbi:MAG: 50S ribosomal protein L23 [Candidatus Margulisiibacteriota bacterium]|jgi:large subunit ribosomal protein L23
MRVIPVVTEKSAALKAQGKYVFYVDPTVNKVDIQRFFKSAFGVDAVAVNVLNVKGKTRRRRNIQGATQDRKKVVVTLKKGQEIDAVKGLF